MRLLLGGSPCTRWSIAQSKARETTPEGQGWELFKNYLIAREKFAPHYFLYENNKSMALAIQKQITRELGVEPVLINSALLSAQNRQRLYWTDIPGVELPEDRSLVLRDILDNGSFPANDTAEPDRVKRLGGLYGQHSRWGIFDVNGKAPCLTASAGMGGGHVPMYPVRVGPGTVGSKTYPVYEVQDGFISMRGTRYPIKLADGFYTIQKLTVRECMRLQTVPERYIFPVSNSQTYKMLGNGWTVDVIAHILSHCPGITTEPLEVLSMYDGMSCGRIALDKLGSSILHYYATEIDKYAIQTTQANYPDTIQLGDAFQVRDNGWRLP